MLRISSNNIIYNINIKKKKKKVCCIILHIYNMYYYIVYVKKKNYREREVENMKEKKRSRECSRTIVHKEKKSGSDR